MKIQPTRALLGWGWAPPPAPRPRQRQRIVDDLLAHADLLRLPASRLVADIQRRYHASRQTAYRALSDARSGGLQ